MSPRMSSPELNLDRAAFASRPSPPPRPPRRGPGFSFGRVVLLVAVIAAVAAVGYALFYFGPALAQIHARNRVQEIMEQTIESAVNSGGSDAGDGGEATPCNGIQPVMIPLDNAIKAKALAAIPETYTNAIANYIFPSGDEILGWFKIVHDSDYVQNNAAYKELAANTRFRYDETSDEVNAYASPWDKVVDEVHANLIFLGGFVRYTRVIGAVMASGALAGTNATPRLELLTSKIAAADSSMPAEKALELISECGVAPEWFLNEAFVQEARNIANGIGMFVAGHEVGHVMYGHIWRTAGINAETSRNKERDADSFSFSVSSEEKYYAMGSISRYMFVGNVYLMLAWTARDAMDVTEIANERGVSSPEDLASIRAEIMTKHTHPFSGERLLNLLTSKEDMAKQYGLDVAQLSANLRELGIH